MNFDELSSITCPICCRNCHRELSLFFKLFGKCNLQCGKNRVKKNCLFFQRPRPPHFLLRKCNKPWTKWANFGRKGEIMTPNSEIKKQFSEGLRSLLMSLTLLICLHVMSALVPLGKMKQKDCLMRLLEDALFPLRSEKGRGDKSCIRVPLTLR